MEFVSAKQRQNPSQLRITEANVVYKKHYPPALMDDAWRLEKIGKDGPFHKRLKKAGIYTVEDFLRLESAGVSVYFQEIIDKEDVTIESVEGSDFVITRVAFRDNSSKYYINDRGSNFTEVTKKLKGKGVDLDNNWFLILQGEVEQISLMKPKAQGPHDEGFLEYLEDIIGTDQYVEKIEEAYKQLEILNEKRSGVVQMVKLSEKEKDSLESIKNEAEAYMLKELILLKWQEKAANLASDDATSHVIELQDSISNLEGDLSNKREKIQQNSETLKELEAVHQTYLKQHEMEPSGAASPPPSPPPSPSGAATYPPPSPPPSPSGAATSPPPSPPSSPSGAASPPPSPLPLVAAGAAPHLREDILNRWLPALGFIVMFFFQHRQTIRAMHALRAPYDVVFDFLDAVVRQARRGYRAFDRDRWFALAIKTLAELLSKYASSLED